MVSIRAKMFGQEGFRRPGVPVADGLDDDDVIVECGLRSGGQGQEPHPVHMRLLFADQGPDIVMPGNLADLPVKPVVETVKQLAVVGLHRSLLLFQAGLPDPLIWSSLITSIAARMQAISSAVRTNFALSTAASEILVITVARCGRISRNPSWDSR